MVELDDKTLLAQFAQEGSEAAFAALAERHAGLVHSVALRSVGDTHAAEEITQAVFIILAQKAGKLSARVILSGWLYQTTRLTASNYLRGEMRRRQREEEAFMQSALNESHADTQAAWQRIAPLLDGALDKLGGRDRDAIALRFFENKSLADVGAALGTSEDAAKMRVNRALEKLRKVFSKRDVTLSLALIASAVAANSVQAAPAGLAATVTTAATSGATISTTITTLIKGTMKTMTWLKIKFAVGVGLATLVAGGAATVAVSQINGTDKLTAQEILAQANAAYAALRSYSDSGRVITTATGVDTTTAFHIRLERPDRYRVDWSTPSQFFTNQGCAWSDGNGDYFSMGDAGKTEIAKPEKLESRELALASATGVSSGAAHTIPGIFYGEYAPIVLRAFGQTDPAVAVREPDEKVGGIPCHVLSIHSATAPNEKVKLWIGRADHLLHQTERVVENPSGAMRQIPEMSDADIKQALEQANQPATPAAIAEFRKMMKSAAQAAPKLGKMSWTEIHEHIVVNPKFSPEDFKQ